MPLLIYPSFAPRKMRLKSTLLGIIAAPPFIAALGWLWQEKVHISAVCVIFFFTGFFSMYVSLTICLTDVTDRCFSWPYTSALAYIVDSNTGRSSTAVATNSAFRGLFAFVALEVAVPMQVGIGNGRFCWYCISSAMLTMNFRMDDDAMGVFDTYQWATRATCILEG